MQVSTVVQFLQQTSDATCTEIDGGYQCACDEGYRGDGVNVCLDIDECAELKCSMFSTCENSIGSYELGCRKFLYLLEAWIYLPCNKCTCFERYEGDGINCTFIDYCKQFPCAEGASCVSQGIGEALFTSKSKAF